MRTFLLLELYETLDTWLGNTKLLHLINIIWHVYHINCILSSRSHMYTYLCTVTHRKTITSSYIFRLVTFSISCCSCYRRRVITRMLASISTYNIILLSIDGLPHTTITGCSGAYLTSRSLKLW